MKTDRSRATVLALDPAAPPSSDGLVLGGRLMEVSQSHLLEPFAAVLASVEEIATLGAGGSVGNGPNEESCVRAAYRSLYEFFHALLPSANHDAIDGLTYSVALLLVREAIETGRVVVVPATESTSQV